MSAQFPYITPAEDWDGAPLLVKAGPGHLIALEITVADEGNSLYLHYHDTADTSAVAIENRFWVSELKAEQTTSLQFGGGVWQDFVGGLVLQVTDSASMTGGGAPTKPLILCGRYR